jgi:hypothetical protein
MRFGGCQRQIPRFSAVGLKKTVVLPSRQSSDGNAKTVLFGFGCTAGGA